MVGVAEVLEDLRDGNLTSYNYRLPFWHHWRSFRYVCDDSGWPARLYLPRQPKADPVFYPNPQARILVVVGDGAFQMTGMELSTIVRYSLNPIVVVLNNHGYTTERFLLDGSFNDIRDWAYHKIPDVLGGGLGLEVRSLAELETALDAALK